MMEPSDETGRALAPLTIVILGLSITSAWGNGHATTYRSLVRALDRRGHRMLFLERDMPWYAANRDLPHPPFGQTELYQDLEDLKRRFAGPIGEADLVIVGSYVPEGVAVGNWVGETARGLTAFYDIDTPITLAKQRRGDYEYVDPHLAGAYGLYLSFAGGPILDTLARDYGATPRPLYCSVDPEFYYQEEADITWDLGYMGTYSADRQPGLQRFMLDPTRGYPSGRFVVAGPNYPADVCWPKNVERIEHLPPERHRGFYNAQRYTLNLTRADMIEAGYSPSVRLFEAAACGTPIISDYWSGLESFFALGSEILVARTAQDVLGYLLEMSEYERKSVGRRAYEVVLGRHTADHRAQELEAYVAELAGGLQAPPLAKLTPGVMGTEPYGT